MQVIQSPLFLKKVKKLHKKQKVELDKQVRLIIQKPNIGQQKKGDLKKIFVHKFKVNKVQYLLAYRYKKHKIELITLGTHENYYRNLKTYIKSQSS